MYSPHFRRREFCPPSLRAEYLHKLCEILCTGDLSFLPIYLFIHLINYISINARIFIFYFGLESNTSLFSWSNSSSFGKWKLFQFALLSLWYVPINVGFGLSTSLLSCTTTCACLFSCPTPTIRYFLRNPGSFGEWHWKPRWGWWVCSLLLGCCFFRPSQLTEQGNIYAHTRWLRCWDVQWEAMSVTGFS